MEKLSFLLFTVIIIIIGCGVSDTEEGCVDISEGELPAEGTPTQFCVEDGPEIGLIYNPDGAYVIDDKPALNFVVTVIDSMPHLKWIPTKLLVETDQDFSKNVLLTPFACIIPIKDSPEEFPFNVEWWSCNRIGINNDNLLTNEQVEQIEKLVHGRLSHRYIYPDSSGGTYRFDLEETGRPTIEESIVQINSLNYIDGDVFHANNFPRCWLSDAIPRPPCPSWYLVNEIRISLEGEKEHHIPVQEGGWVKATYTLPDGTTKSTTFTVPEIEQ